MNTAVKTLKSSVLIRAVEVAVFSGGGGGVAFQTWIYAVLSYRKSRKEKYFYRSWRFQGWRMSRKPALPVLYLLHVF